MKVYRGPISKPFSDASHEYVSGISPSQLEEGIRSKALIRFNITKVAYERQAVCTAVFEEQDLIPMMEGLLDRLKASQECLAKIKAVVIENQLTPEQRLLKVQRALAKLG